MSDSSNPGALLLEQALLLWNTKKHSRHFYLPAQSKIAKKLLNFIREQG
jgi:hypothetical protein